MFEPNSITEKEIKRQNCKYRKFSGKLWNKSQEMFYFVYQNDGSFVQNGNMCTKSLVNEGKNYICHVTEDVEFLWRGIKLKN